MTRPSDTHWSLLTPAQRRKTRIILETLGAGGIPCVLGGGWAVYAHESTTPSPAAVREMGIDLARRVGKPSPGSMIAFLLV